MFRVSLVLAALLSTLAFVPATGVAQTGFCPPHNPNALSNGCVMAGTQADTVYVPVPYAYGEWICVISYYCVPYVGFTQEGVLVKAMPYTYGYVEVGALCMVSTLECHYAWDTRTWCLECVTVGAELLP